MSRQDHIIIKDTRCTGPKITRIQSGSHPGENQEMARCKICIFFVSRATPTLCLAPFYCTYAAAWAETGEQANGYETTSHSQRGVMFNDITASQLRIQWGSVMLLRPMESRASRHSL